MSMSPHTRRRYGQVVNSWKLVAVKKRRGICYGIATAAVGMTEVLTAPRSPWQNPYTERVIGSIRRECTNHVIVLGERHLKRILNSYVDYYNKTRTHLSLDKDAPEARPIYPPGHGKVVELKRVGGLHQEYVRRAA